MFVYIKEGFVLENKCCTPNALAETYIIYIFPVKIAFHLKKCHKNTRTEILITEIISLKQEN